MHITNVSVLFVRDIGLSLTWLVRTLSIELRELVGDFFLLDNRINPRCNIFYLLFY